MNYKLLFVLIFLYGCFKLPSNYKLINGSFNTEPVSECSPLIKEVKKRWAIHQSIHCYHLDKPLLKEIVRNQSCFLNVDTSQIIRLFGLPNRKYQQFIGYNLSSSCKEGDDFYGDFVLNFYHDNKGLSKKVVFEKVTVLE